jgi:hypothetical protein
MYNFDYHISFFQEKVTKKIIVLSVSSWLLLKMSFHGLMERFALRKPLITGHLNLKGMVCSAEKFSVRFTITNASAENTNG